MFAYAFQNMFDWYSENLDSDMFESDKSIALYVISKSQKYEELSKRQIKKHNLKPLGNNKEAYIGAFMKRHITDVAKFKKQKTHHNFPLGLYCVLGDNEMYAVFPTKKENRLFADHLTFMQGNVHLTTYTPHPLSIDYGVVSHIPKCHLPDGTILPLTGYSCKTFDKMGAYKADILDICRAYTSAQPKATAVGGVRGAIRKKAMSTTLRRADISPKLEQLLLRNNIQGMQIFCIQNDGAWDVTVVLQGNDLSDDVEDMSFRCTSKRWQSLQAQMIRRLM